MSQMTKFLLIFFCCLLSNTIFSNDPLEEFNKITFSINKELDKNIAIPVAKGYQAITPNFVEVRISNAIFNIEDISIGLNNFLQGKVLEGVSDLTRFFINSTLGLGGLFNLATSLGLQKHDEDFGQTLAVWGVPDGPYIVLPVMGPSTLRDAGALIVDGFMSPSIIMDHERTIYSLQFLDLIDTRSRYLGLESLTIGDEYLFFKDAYYQTRQYEINDGVVEDEFDDFFEELE